MVVARQINLMIIVLVVVLKGCGVVEVVGGGLVEDVGNVVVGHGQTLVFLTLLFLSCNVSSRFFVVCRYLSSIGGEEL